MWIAAGLMEHYSQHGASTVVIVTFSCRLDTVFERLLIIVGAASSIGQTYLILVTEIQSPEIATLASCIFVYVKF